MAFNAGDYFSSKGRFINNGLQVVDDVMMGYLASDPKIGLLNYGKVVVRRDYRDIDIVKVVSGGGSGHEPAHAGFVGKGMLTAAIQGDVFTSPPTCEVFKTLRELSYKRDTGILMIIANNMSDRINFGLAVERACNKLFLAIRMIIVAEDCCSPDVDYRGPRGLSGVILLNKIAGAMAENNMLLEEMYRACQQVRENMSSVSLCLQSNTSPNLDTCICCKHGDKTEMQIGSGLSGECGICKIKKTTVKETCGLLFDHLVSLKFQLDAINPVVLLINNLGSSMMLEELIFVKEFVGKLLDFKIPIARVYHGRYMTALDMQGFSVTILKITDPKILEYLDAPCEALFWKKVNFIPVDPTHRQLIPARVSERKLKSPPGPSLNEEMANILLLACQFICDALISSAKQINMFDAESGGGNVGSKVKRGCERILTEVNKSTLDFKHPRLMLEELSGIFETVVGGTLGSLYSIGFEAAVGSLKELPEEFIVDVHKWVECLSNANEAIKSYGQVEYGSQTMYDPLHVFLMTIKKALNDGSCVMDAFEQAVESTEKAALSTKAPQKRFPDAGAHVVAIWMRALFEGIKMSLQRLGRL